MTVQGQNMLSIVRATQRLNSEIAALIKTFEKLAGDRGYRNGRSSSITKDCSASLDSPQLWAPPYLYRLLQHKDNKDDILTLNVILDEPDNPKLGERLAEPVVLLARFTYKKGGGKDWAGEWDPEDLFFFGPSKAFNTVYRKKSLQLDSKDFLDAAEWELGTAKALLDVAFLAIPLAEIADSKTLDEQLLRKVL